jgi:pimeloyl-ACP methyl ester carboxylesterase
MIHKRFKHIVAMLLVIVLSIFVPIIGVQTISAESISVKKCYASYIPVSLVSGGPANQRVYGELCLPTGATPSTVQLLIHGATYDHNYWDYPGFNGKYSYVDSSVKSRYATFNIDRIGSGKSSHPLSTSIDLYSDAWVAHQLVQALRKGKVTGPTGSISFKKVIAVGHSYGTGVTWIESSKYHDVDAVILTGAIRELQYDTLLTKGAPNLYPASLDPKFGLFSQDLGYLTTRPGTRYQTLMEPGDVDPAVVEQDEKLKQTITATQMATFPIATMTVQDIRVPVLLVVGEKDTLFCGKSTDCSTPESVVKAEKSHLGPNVPSIDGYVLKGGGHDINLMRNAQDWFTYAVNWADQRIGSQVR